MIPSYIVSVTLESYHYITDNKLISFCNSAMCYSGAHAGVDVQTQGIWAESKGLSQNNSFPEVAANGSAPRQRQARYD